MLHTNVAGSVMFPTVSPNFTLRNLQHDDLDGIRALYPPIRPTIREQTSIINSDGRLKESQTGAAREHQFNVEGEVNLIITFQSPPPQVEVSEAGGQVGFL